ncbi:MAG: copper resistance protein NlpE N-terminal domain-containing protein [Sphingobacteriales bacterium]|jgi:copper homeostasis protein (lipoprotein)|nr:copper resistance protein NlpE N-terminal domain-containing protein [Sphingobacteriales bacterium]
MKKLLLLSLSLIVLNPIFAQKKKDKKNPWLSTAPATAVKDWDGAYLGVVPCPNCEGIQTMIKLNKDNTYTIQTKYLGKGTDILEDKGKIYWNSDGFNLLLLNGSDSSFIKLSLNQITLLDAEGKVVSGEYASFYNLKKDKLVITEKYWKLIELNGKPLPNVSREKEPFIVLKDKGKNFGGNAGCNTLIGKYELADRNKISFSDLVTTMMACPDPDTELAIRDALESTDHYVIDGDFLRLEDARNRVNAKFLRIYLK